MIHFDNEIMMVASYVTKCDWIIVQVSNKVHANGAEIISKLIIHRVTYQRPRVLSEKSIIICVRLCSI